MPVRKSVTTLQFALVATLCAQMTLPVSMLSQAAQPSPQQAQSPAAPSGMMQDDATMQNGTPVPIAPAPRLPLQTVNVQTRTLGQPLSMEDRYRLVLDRFTYGPRPGDLTQLEKTGMNGWFSQQLNPWKIDDSALDARLAQYPAMQMPLYKLMELYPDGQTVRQAMNGRASAPGGDAAHAIYNDAEARYRVKKENKDKTKDPQTEEVEVIPLPKTPAEILAMNPADRFKAICHLTLPQFKELRKELEGDQRQQLTDGFTPAQLEAIAAFNNPKGVVEAEDVQTKLLRDVYSERQLQEIMVDFWLNHFNVYIKKSQQAPYYIAAYDRNSIRPYALGSFENLLLATAESPAMLNYLDASESVGPHSEYVVGFDHQRQGKNKKASGLNENYAREVMELHTVGVNGGYTQKDVTELAKVFTGWTVARHRETGVEAQAQFDPSKHEPGDKTVLGHRIRANGEQEGIEALKMLAESPQCAKFISTKLAVRFVGDEPPTAMIDRMTATFLQTKGDIRKVLVAMINSPEFFTTATYRAKVKTPQDYVISAVRAAGSDVQSTAGLAAAISDLGMPLYGMQTPNGYSMKTEAWNSTTALVSRMNFAMALATNRVSGVTTNLDALLGPQAATLTAAQKTEKLEAKLLDAPVSPRTQNLILAQAQTDGNQQVAELRQVSGVAEKRNPLEVGQQRRQERRAGEQSPADTQASLAAGLILGSPEFQRR
jgi:uncharacterized protein (DUF1800 family)